MDFSSFFSILDFQSLGIYQDSALQEFTSVSNSYLDSFQDSSEELPAWALGLVAHSNEKS